MTIAWLYIYAGIILGTVGDYLMKASQGFTYLWIGVAAVLLYMINVILWGIAIKTLPLGSAYAVWTSLGTLAALGVGIIFFGESLTALKVLFIAMLLVGCIGLTLLEEAK